MTVPLPDRAAADRAADRAGPAGQSPTVAVPRTEDAVVDAVLAAAASAFLDVPTAAADGGTAGPDGPPLVVVHEVLDRTHRRLHELLDTAPEAPPPTPPAGSLDEPGGAAPADDPGVGR